jgi:patatin-like phospholipase/acyl hydrolase
MADKGQKLRILSLDGGGFRALSSLLILQEMMDMIRTAEGRSAEDEPCPCDHFEYITGTGIGGYDFVFFYSFEN